MQGKQGKSVPITPLKLNGKLLREDDLWSKLLIRRVINFLDAAKGEVFTVEVLAEKLGSTVDSVNVTGQRCRNKIPGYRFRVGRRILWGNPESIQALKEALRENR